ncbi:MAG: hypothetical protein NTX24_01550 [Candidatus Pacearchaeota archaeon]|nr:hypothetical protein [Candidatus Pacearchaeota archaeon]
MKLLRKIAPFAISALMVGSMAAAADIHSWKSTFTAANTAVVVGSGSNIGTDDITAAIAIANAVGIDTTTSGGSTSVTGESYLFKKTSTLLTLNSSRDALDEIRGTITKDQMPVTLADGIYKDTDNNDNDYTQKITIGTGLSLTYFADKKYKGEKTPALGLDLADNSPVMNYTLTFTDKPTFSSTQLETTMINILGKDYYISDAGSNAATNKTLTLLDTGVTGTVVEGQTATIGGKTVSILYVTSDSKVKLMVGSETTTKLSVGGTYKLSDGTYIGVKDVFYNAHDTGTSNAEISVGNGKIDISDRETVQINGKAVTGLTGFIANETDTLKSITLQWDLSKESFVAPDSYITLPGFESVKFLMTEMTFPTGEEIEIGPSGDDAFEITVPIKDDTVTIPLLSQVSDANYFSSLGAEATDRLKTSNTTTLIFNETLGDSYFVVSYAETDIAESYYMSAELGGGDETDGWTVTLHNEATNEDVCSESVNDTECQIGDAELTFNEVGEDFFNVTVNTGGSFNKLYTAKGALIYLPYSTLLPGTNAGAINITNSTQSASWNLTMVEADKDGNLGSGATIKYLFDFTSGDTYSTVIGITGVTTIPTVDNDHESGYVTSDLATFVEWDKSGTEYSAKATYYGEEVYGNVYLAAASAGTSGGSGTTWTPVKDSETTAYSSKNVIAIGGTAVNKVARKILGLDENTVVTGSETAWRTATGVDGAGKGILDLVASPYTTGKYALLVAGYEGPDTAKTADFLTIKFADVAAGKTKVLVDTINVVEASI